MNVSTTPEVAAVTAVLDRLTAAWNAGDGAAYGAEFTADATYVTYVGTLYVGGAEIGRAHQALFESFLKGTRLASEIVGVRFSGPDTALVVTRGDVHKGRPGKLGKIQTYTLVRQADGGWKVAAFQNTKHRALIEAVSFRARPATRPAAVSS
ncbi:SgcJ/EcaC family oxidoreductase [Microbispora hainanensis]|uniref:SgcJ/EcaC family oxidoreductase n=1 Tax=Microbispora hainanensis TaxID=568844 RepID=A0ABZ1SJL8_9ACTN|nr:MULTISPECIES: SgcJ/EcaC family oxidoreductase [Microbispora]